MSERIAADVVVIGSGVAGALIGWSLRRKGLDVVVLEAGPRVRSEDIVAGFRSSHALDLSSGYPNPAHAPRPDWADPDDDYIITAGPEVSRAEYLRVVGGTTWHWGAATPRFYPEDFRMRSTHGVGVDWPFGDAEINPWYAAAERELGVSGNSDHLPTQQFPLPPIPPSYSDRAIQAALATIDIPVINTPVAINSVPYDARPRCQGYGTCSPICPSAARYSAIHHVDKAERLGARVMADTRVDEILTGADNRISKVLARKPDRTTVTVTGQVYVLAANTLESPRLLLMNADSRNPRGLANRSGQVGRNYMDHLGVHHRIVLPRNLYPGRGPNNTMSTRKFCVGDFRKQRAGYILYAHNHVFLQQAASRLLAQGLEPPVLDAAIAKEALGAVEFETIMEQLPNPENRIEIDPSRRDSAGQPRIRQHYSVGEYERAGLAHVRSVLAEIAEALGGSVVHSHGPVTRSHPMGTTRMGLDPDDSVVNPGCRSHDHDNLYVVGGGVFPTGGTSHPTLTIAALALRAAHNIQQRLEA